MELLPGAVLHILLLVAFLQVKKILFSLFPFSSFYLMLITVTFKTAEFSKYSDVKVAESEG